MPLCRDFRAHALLLFVALCFVSLLIVISNEETSELVLQDLPVKYAGNFTCPQRPNDRFLAVISVFKQEAMTLQEWVDHYLWQGVDHFFLIDNDSTDNPRDILEPYIRCGLVTYSTRKERYRQPQLLAETYGSPEAQAYTWIIDADLDEFWFAPQRGSTLKSELANPASPFADADAIVGQWYMFGTSGQVQQPASVRRSNLLRWPEPDVNTKWIAKTSRIDQSKIGLHWKDLMSSNAVRDLQDRIRLHHYPLQSREFFEKVKMTRGDATTPHSNSVRTWAYFDRYDNSATLEDRTLADLLDG